MRTEVTQVESTQGRPSMLAKFQGPAKTVHVDPHVVLDIFRLHVVRWIVTPCQKTLSRPYVLHDNPKTRKVANSPCRTSPMS